MTAYDAPRPVELSGADRASFEDVRSRLFGIAYRVLGSAADADDVVQDAWLRWQRTDRSEVRDAGAFLATTTTRLAINVTRSARARHETHIESQPVDQADGRAEPALEAEQGEALELALRRLLEKLSPAERAAYVLREAFDYRYREIGEVLALEEANARQLLARARRHLHCDHRRRVDAAQQHRLLDAFVIAARSGELATLERLLAADAATQLRAD